MSDKDHDFGSLVCIYAQLLPNIREAGKAMGYAIAVHGSMRRDFDLLAVPWVEDAKPAQELVDFIAKEVSGFVIGDLANRGEVTTNPTKQPHGRMSWNICWGGNVFIDLSVFPPGNWRKLTAEPATGEEARAHLLNWLATNTTMSWAKQQEFANKAAEIFAGVREQQPEVIEGRGQRVEQPGYYIWDGGKAPPELLFMDGYFAEGHRYMRCPEFPARPAFAAPPKPELVLFRPKNGREPAQWAVRKRSGDVVASDGYCWSALDVELLDDAGNVIKE